MSPRFDRAYLTDLSNTILHKLMPFFVMALYPEQHNFGVREVSRCIQLSSGFSADVMEAKSLDTRSAPNSSKRGMLWFCIGETLVFATTNLAYHPLPIYTRRYTTAAYALGEASQNPIRLQDLLSSPMLK